VHFAKRLIEETSMPMGQIAGASGFASIRRFNTLIRKSFGRSPTEIRGGRPGGKAIPRSDHLDLRLAYRPPLMWEEILRTLAPRATPGVESVDGDTYRRTVSHEGRAGIIELRPSPGHSLSLRVIGPLYGSIFPIAERVRDLFDLRSDAHSIRICLLSDSHLKERIGRHPIPRVLGAWDGFETAVRIVLGQQISVKGATTIAGRVAARHGEPISEPRDRLRVLFPTPEVLAAASLDGCGLTKARVQAVRALARAVREGRIVLHPSSDPQEVREGLLALPGIGSWTAETIVMRALGHPDAFPAGDLGLRKALALNGKLPSERQVLALSEAWRPWRAYAAMVLWRDSGRKPEEEP
jgi:AraC family transcriptional regulator of adaptative response / DNA-3-methyladenine glycosylase II